MREIWHAHSTNGRWGVAIVCADDDQPELTYTKPRRGTLTRLGKAGGRDVFRFAAEEKAESWVFAWAGDGAISPVQGASSVYRSDLQSGRSASVLLLGPQAIVRRDGYRGRGCTYILYVGGVEVDCPDSVLLAMGLLRPLPPAEPEPAPEPVSSTMADALRAAGIATS